MLKTTLQQSAGLQRSMPKTTLQQSARLLKLCVLDELGGQSVSITNILHIILMNVLTYCSNEIAKYDMKIAMRKLRRKSEGEMFVGVPCHAYHTNTNDNPTKILRIVLRPSADVLPLQASAFR